MEHGSEYLYTNLLVALCGFLLLVAAIRHYAPRTPLPAESWLLLAGIVYGLLSPHAASLPTVKLNPEIVISMLLPILMFTTGRRLPVALLLRSASPITVLILIGTPLGIFMIGLPIAWLLDIPYMHGLLFAIPLVATDPASVIRILNNFEIPERLRILLHGESIFNDALTIVAFSALAATLLGQNNFSIGTVAITTLRSMLLAVPVGLLLGWIVGLLVRHWREQNRVPGLTLTLVLPFAGFLLSEHLLHASGIIAVLCTALAFSHSRRGCDPERAELYDELWEYLGSISASMLYFALGAAIAAQRFPLAWTLPAAVVLLLLSRAVLVYGSGPLLRTQGCSLPASWRHVIMFGGLRGVVPAALALMMPADYVHRESLLTLVFVLVAYTIIVHPLLLRWYLQRQQVHDLAVAAPEYGSEDSDATLPPMMARFLHCSAWGLAGIAGVVAGIVFLVLEMLLVPLLQGANPWVPVQMMAAIGLGPEVLPPTEFSGNIAFVAMVVHFTLSLVYAWILAPMIEDSTLSKGIMLGTLFGLALYLVNFYLFTAIFPWFANARTGVTLFAHFVFGATLAGCYLLLRRNRYAHSDECI